MWLDVSCIYGSAGILWHLLHVGVEGIVSASSKSQAAAVPADPEHLRQCWSKCTASVWDKERWRGKKSRIPHA